MPKLSVKNRPMSIIYNFDRTSGFFDRISGLYLGFLIKNDRTSGISGLFFTYIYIILIFLFFNRDVGIK